MSKKVSIKCEGHLPFEVSYRLFVANSEKFANENNNGIDFGDQFKYVSIVEFFRAIENNIPNITDQIVYEFELLCDIWEVTRTIKKFSKDFFDNSEEDLTIPKLIFFHEHNRDITQQLKKVKSQLPKYVDDPKLKELDYNILLQIIDFRDFQNRDEDFHKIFSFCLDYMDEHRNDKNCSELFSTINISCISIDDQRELENRSYFDRSVLNDSIGKAFTNIDVSLKEILELVRFQYAQEMIVEIPANPPLYYPDWSIAEGKGWSNITSAICCWLFAYSANNNQNNPALIKINNLKQFNVSGCSANYGGSSISIPIKNTQQITFLPNSYTENQAFFVPFKNNNDIVSLPNYSESKPKIWYQRNVAEKNGWIYACSGSCDGKATITINDSKSINFSYHSSNYNSFGSIFIPISCGDSYQVTCAANPYSLIFIPGKEHTQTGFPDYEKETILGWGQTYTADEPGWIYAQSISNNCASNNPQNSPAYLTVNGTVFLVSQINGNYLMMSSIFVPVSKGDKYCTCGGYSSTLISFIPFIKEDQIQ